MQIDHDLISDNEYFTLVGFDKATRRLLIFNNRLRVEDAIRLAHGSGGASLPELASLDEFIDLLSLPRWSEPDKKTGKVREIQYSLSGRLGNSILDALGESARHRRIFIDRNLRPGLGAARLPDGRVVFNFGDAFMLGGSLHPMTGVMCRYLDPGDGDEFSREVLADADPRHRHSLTENDPAEVQSLVDEIADWDFAGGSDAHLTWLGWWGAALLSGCLEWRPHYSLIAEGGAGKTWLFEEVARRLLGRLILTSDDFTDASLHIKAGSHSLPFYIDEANATKTDQMEAVREFMRTASNGGFRDRADKETDYRRVRSTIMRCSVYRAMNTSNDPNDIPNKRRIIYEHIRKRSIDNFLSDKAILMKSIVRRIGASLRRHWITSADLFSRRCDEIRTGYDNDHKGADGCVPLASPEIDTAAPIAVACEIALGWEPERTLQMVCRVGLAVRVQVEDDARPKWAQAVEAIAYSHLGRVNNRDYTIAETVDRVRHNLGFAQSGGEYEVPLPDPVDKLAEVGISVRRDGDVVIRAGLVALHQRIRGKWPHGNGLRDALIQCPFASETKGAFGEAGRQRGVRITRDMWDTCAPGWGDDDDGEAQPSPPEPPPPKRRERDDDLSFDDYDDGAAF